MTNHEDTDTPTKNPDSQPSPQSPAPATPPTPPQHEVRNDSTEGTHSQEDTARELAREFRWVEFAQLIVNGVLVVVGIYALCIYNGQLKVMRGQLGEVIKQFPEIQKSANAAKSAAETANATLKSSQKSFEIDQRPYLVSQIPEFFEPPAPNKEIYANETIKNIGRTPALKRITSISFTRYDPGSRGKFIKFLKSEFNKLRATNEAVSKEMEANASIVPYNEADTAPQDSYFATNPNSIKLSEKELQNLRDAKEITLFYLGLVNYQDSFGNRYETQFCYYYFGRYIKTWHICDSHNIIR
jgi:hypothetical protein